MLVFSHRGYHRNVPENTLEAFQQAVVLGVDGIETDVRLSRDGLPVLFHDRLSPDGQQVASLTQKELSESVGYAVPTLDQALNQWDGIIWNVEIKTPEVLEVAASVLSQYRNSRRLIVTSFWHNVVHHVSWCLGLTSGVLIAHRPATMAHLEAMLGQKSDDMAPAARTTVDGRAGNLAPGDGLQKPGTDGRVTVVVWHFEMLDADLIREAAARGLQSFAWGMLTREEHNFCAGLHLTGIITDFPEFVLKEK